jgi:outer membrane protein assembly factor BamB
MAHAVDGREKWRTALGPFTQPHGMAASPILAAGSVIVVADQVADSFITAFDTATGKIRWKTPRPNFVGSYSTPVLVENNVVLGGPVEMVAYDAKTGEKRWSIPKMGVMPIGSPVCEGNRIFVNNDAVPPFEALAKEMKGDRNGDGKLTPDEFPDPSFKEAVLAIDRTYGNGDGAVDQAEWDGALTLMETMNALVAVQMTGTTAKELWRTEKKLADASTPLLYEGVLYLVRNGGVLSSLDSGTGRILRQEHLAEMERAVFASPVAAEGKVYVVNESGRIAVIRAGGEWRVLAVNDVREKCYATPALVQGIILIRSEHSLWAFQQK